GSTKKVNDGISIGDRLVNAVVRSVAGVRYLWTCHQIVVNRAGNNDPPADRAGIAWYKISTENLTITDSGRIYDTNTTATPMFYFTPSIAVNVNGDMAVGFSGSS